MIKDATLVSEGREYRGSVLLSGERIERVWEGDVPSDVLTGEVETVDAEGLWLLPGVIDDQVHFREPGLTHKADIHSESVAAVAGGVTSYMEMPNTVPQTTTQEALQWKFDRAAETSVANYSFYMGADNSNLEEVKKSDFSRVCGVKVFMGSSTGNMLVDDTRTLEGIFSEIPAVVAVHCEQEEIVRANRERYTARFGEQLPVMFHPLIRSAEACYASSAKAVELASKYGTRLHVLHLSTARELTLFEDRPLEEKRITGEVCVHHLFFDDNDYARYGNAIKWNPAVKTTADRLALLSAVNGHRIDVVATDHAPHLWSEKQGSCLKAASGGPLVQHSLLTMLELHRRGEIALPQIVEKMCHAPARLFGIRQRGYIREGYYADLVLVDPRRKFTVTPENILSRCGWSPFAGHTFPAAIQSVYVNGTEVCRNGVVDRSFRGKELRFGA